MKVFSQRKLINAMLILALFILAGTSILAYFQIQRLIDANSLVIHTHKVIENADQAMLAITEAESRASLFVITKDKQNLQTLPVIVTKIK
jgi:CHASE3 domain sensor protein